MVARFISILLVIVSLFILLPLTYAPVTYANVSALVDRTNIGVSETIKLEINLSEGSSGTPDLTALERDFSILSQSQNQQYSIINGKSSKKHSWTITLMPEKVGELIIPAILIGKESTQPIKIQVNAGSTSTSSQTLSKKGLSKNSSSKKNGTSNQDVFMDVQINPKDEVYVQQKIDLSIQIYYRVRLSQMSLGQLVINDVIMEQVGEDKSYNKVINKQNYRVVERHYALFPQKSGVLTIPPIRFEGMQSVSSNRGFGGFFAPRGKPIYTQSNPISMTVKKKPDSYTGKYWLPAEGIQFISQHSDLSDIKVGDSITITDKIVAKSVLGNLLPTLNWPKLSNLKSYPDKATVNSQVNNNDIYGLREEKMAIIPTSAGQHQLPDRKFIWWNTISNKQVEKIIPGISFNVAEAQSTLSEADQLALQLAKQRQLAKQGQTKENREKAQLEHQLEQQLKQNKINHPNAILDTDNESEIPSNKSIAYTKTSQNPWFWAWLISSIILTILLTISLYFVFNKPKKKNKTDKINDKSIANKKNLINNIKSACSKNDKVKSYHFINQWSQKYPDKIFADNSELANEINILEQSLYSSSIAEWNGQNLLSAFKNYLKKSQNKNSELVDLLPLNLN